MVDMQILEAYLLLFTDALVGNLIIPTEKEYVYRAMISFGSYNKILVVLVASLGSLCAFLFNYYFGTILKFIKKETHEPSKDFLKLSNFAHKFANFAMIFCYLPVVGPIISTICGMSKNNIKIFILIGFLSKCAFYIAKIYL